MLPLFALDRNAEPAGEGMKQRMQARRRNLQSGSSREHSTTVQHQTVQLIPLNQVAVSKRNVRQADRNVDIEAPAAWIASRGASLGNIPRGAAFGTFTQALRMSMKSLLLSVIIAASFSIAACEEKNPAEKAADKIEDVIDEAN